jgi:hypothetical protein
VCWKPIAWRPKGRGRPPHDALRNGRGEWIPPPGWRIIRGRWHQPLSSTQRGEHAPNATAEEIPAPESHAGKAGTSLLAPDGPQGPEREPAPQPPTAGTASTITPQGGEMLDAGGQ